MSTHSEPRIETRDVVYVLNKCIEICTDGEKGYAAAAADVREPELKTFFLEKSKERAEFVRALQTSIEKLGAFPENEGTAKGIVHRGWMDMRLALEGHRDRIVIEEWTRGERAAIDGYRQALERAPLASLPHDIRTMIQNQFSAIEDALEEANRRKKLVH